MENKTKIWRRSPQERKGTYQFNGNMYVTSTIHKNLSPKELIYILKDLYEFVRQNHGADYLQIYVSDTGDKIFVIDNLTKEQKTDKDFDKDLDYFTIMFSYEY